ncbi:MAG: DUF1553 domain-containing protein, partial [Planctomycetes bacterium]|nr:DUF1553 domain-containing protein [Planctomycetota bacterium]
KIMTKSKNRNRYAKTQIVVLLQFLALGTMPLMAQEPMAKVDFNRDVRPILANHCWNCHGQDESSRKAKLRLDLRPAALAKTKNNDHAIVPNNPAASALITRIEANDISQMPPRSFNKPLTANQIKILKQWITEGAPYAEHWAFVPPRKSTSLPKVKLSTWPRNEIDYFILQKLEAAEIKPSLETDRNIWLRRVTLDLTGLPPTLEETKSFLADKAEGAYERVADRLLNSKGHAERMAMHWLDAARYADTNGYNNDEMRTLWPWRDWVIEAFNKNMPYDQFLTTQIAGDLIPNATLSQKVATGFNRNHVLTTEGGIIEEEYRVEYVADRVHTSATVFLGLSMQCARCHDHKYDPITQKDYYRFAAYFNNSPDKLVSYSQGRMAEPLLKVPTQAQLAEKSKLEARNEELTSFLKKRSMQIDADITNWETSLSKEQIETAGPVGVVAHFPLDDAKGPGIANTISMQNPGVIKGNFISVPGRIGKALQFDGNTHISANETGVFESDQTCSFSAWVYPTSNQASTVLSKIDDANAYRGYDVILENGKVASHFINHWPDRALKVVTKKTLSLNTWHHIAVTYDGSRKASGVKIYADGQLQELEITTNNKLEGSLKTDKPFHIGMRQSSIAFTGKIDDVRLFSTALSPKDVERLSKGETIQGLKEILVVAPANRSAIQSEQLKSYYLDHVDSQAKQIKAELSEIPKKLAELEKAMPVTMVMGELSPRRPTHILKRGQYDQHGEVVDPGVPGIFAALPTMVPNRLELARWLTNPNHPLTSRVAVNRLWEMLFGTGLVETSEDFGIQGALPSHPELLDWLALELIKKNWNVREILKQIVLSSTYRQSSNTNKRVLEKDPRNKLLSHAPRSRLPAETVRDNALAISGLLVEQIGGPSVKPYQPDGLWEDVSVERREKYKADLGDGLYRRSMYTFWKRTCPPPGMAAFDAPDRETCVIRRARTNTPLQALVLLNDPTYIEAGRKFAEQILLKANENQARFELAFQMALCRSPKTEEVEVLLKILQTAEKRFSSDPVAANNLTSIGYSKRNEKLNSSTLAAWTTITCMILNLDETISKP